MKQGKPIVVRFHHGREKEYPSVTDAAVDLNLSASTLRNRLKAWAPIRGHEDIKGVEYL